MLPNSLINSNIKEKYKFAAKKRSFISIFPVVMDFFGSFAVV